MKFVPSGGGLFLAASVIFVIGLGIGFCVGRFG